MGRIRLAVIFALMFSAWPLAAWGAPVVDASKYFGGLEGCCLVHDLTEGEWLLRHNTELAARRFSPCSTYKVPHALIALQTGVLSGADDPRKWDRSPQPIKAWQRDHTLASAVRYSVVWYFQRVARAIGRPAMQRWLGRFQYGNRDISSPIDRFWLGGSLRISPEEQIAFLNKLYQGRLPVSAEAARTVKQIIRLESGKGWILSGKTGSLVAGGRGKLGWFVGHVATKGGREYTFAVLLRGEDGAFGGRAKAAARSILSGMGLIESE